MSIEKRGNSYRLRLQVDGQKISKTFDHKPTKAEIQVAIAEGLAKVEENKSLTFEKAAKSLIRSKDNVTSPSTVNGYESILRSLPETFKQMDIYKIEQIHLNNLISDLAKKNSAKTVKNKHGFIHNVIYTYRPDFAINTTLPKEQQKEFTIPSTDDVKKIIKKIKGTEYEVVYSLACYGLRRSEILALTIDDLKDNELTINKAYIRGRDNKYVIRYLNKTDKSTRKIIIDKNIADRIREQGYVYNGTPDQFYKQLLRVEKELGIEEFSPHKFRHYFASAMAQIATEEDIMLLGGWKTPEVMKKVYRHSMLEQEKERKKDLSDQLSKLIF